MRSPYGPVSAVKGNIFGQLNRFIDRKFKSILRFLTCKIYQDGEELSKFLIGQLWVKYLIIDHWGVAAQRFLGRRRSGCRDDRRDD